MEGQDSTGVEGVTGKASGVPGETGNTNSKASGVEMGNQDIDGTIPANAYKKLIAQRKSDTERLSAMESELKAYREKERQIQEQQNLKKGEFDKVLTAYKEEIGSLKNKVQSYEENEIYQRKIYAFQQKLPGSVKKSEYYSFADLNDVQLDLETGDVDELSLERVVSKFVENYGDLIAPHNSKKLPAHGGFGFSGVGKSVKDLSSKELKELYISGKFKGE
jgi:hypothetical protein